MDGIYTEDWATRKQLNVVPSVCAYHLRSGFAHSFLSSPVTNTILAINIRTVVVKDNSLTRKVSNIKYDHVGHPPPPAYTLASTRWETRGILEWCCFKPYIRFISALLWMLFSPCFCRLSVRICEFSVRLRSGLILANPRRAQHNDLTVNKAQCANAPSSTNWKRYAQYTCKKANVFSIRISFLNE